MGIVRIVCVLIAENERRKKGVLSEETQRSWYIQHCTCTQKVAMHSMFNIKEFQAAFSTLYCTVGKCILHRKSAYSVRLHYKECSLKIRCFIREYLSDPYFQSTLPATKMQPCTLCSIYKSFKLLFQRYIALQASVFYDDVAAILSCTEPYLQPKCSHALYVQYTRVSSCFFNAILKCKPMHFSLENLNQCWLTLYRMRDKTQLFI